MFSAIQDLRSKFGASSSWIFGDEVGPTPLDAHVITFIARLCDTNRNDLIPESLQTYGESAGKGKEWQSVTEGKPTLHSLWAKRQEV